MMINSDKYIIIDMKKHLEVIFENMKNDINNIIKKVILNYNFNKNNIYLNYNIHDGKININSFSLQGKVKKYNFENVYKFKVNEDLCKNDDEPYYYKDGIIREHHPLDTFMDTMDSICIHVEYNTEYHNYDTIKTKRESIFNIACTLSIVGKYGFREQVTYFNGKNMIHYM